MEGTSQWAARWQLRKRPVFTFLLKEIVGILLQRAWEPGREHAWGGVLSHLHATLCSELGSGALRKAHCPRTGGGILGKSLHLPGPQLSHLKHGSMTPISLPGTLTFYVK